MEIKLKPCPFCGAKAKVRRIKDSYKIMCAECGASSHRVHIQPWHDNKFVAQCQSAKAWNVRFAVENEPLALYELRRMKLKEWVWIEVLQPERFREGDSAYYRKCAQRYDDKAFSCGYPGITFDFPSEDYGKSWLAYRLKPEEGAQ